MEITKFPSAQLSKKKNVYVFSVIFSARELCEESMTHSVSSASSLDSHAPSESGGQSHGARWEEQQKVLVLEQLCGVFRVDLGHMRSLRLFFWSVGGGGAKVTGEVMTGLSCCVSVQRIATESICLFIHNKKVRIEKRFYSRSHKHIPFKPQCCALMLFCCGAAMRRVPAASW